jgi:hypothetical protein
MSLIVERPFKATGDVVTGTFRQIAIFEAGALVAPRLAHFDGPQLAAYLDLKNSVRVPQSDLLDDAGELHVFAGRPGPSVMAQCRTAGKCGAEGKNCGEKSFLHDRSLQRERHSRDDIGAPI